MKLLHILGIVLFAHVASAGLFSSISDAAAKAAAAAEAAALEAAAQAAAAAKSVIDTSKTVVNHVGDVVSTVVGSTIVLSTAAVSDLGGTFSDLFGSLTSLVAVVPDGAGGFSSVNLAASAFLLTGTDPRFNASRDVFFMLYTNQNPDGQNVSVSNIASSSFNSANPTRVVIHGYLNNHKSPMNPMITKAYLGVGDFNVIVVDWGYGSYDTSYIDARLRVNAVSIQVAKLINYLISSSLATYDQVVIVGHSLGGQTAGLTAKKIIGGKVKAVIALDPAGPLFPLQPSTSTVQPTDAQYVEAIHCNGGGFGMLTTCAQADFFPNFGSLQKGCGPGVLVCPHLRCYELFAESIAKTNNFVATKCASYSEITDAKCTDQGGKYVMGGEPSNSGISGTFYLATAGSSPYALG